MAILNQSKPSSSMTNAAKIATGETWDSILTTWASETQTWADTASFVDNVSRATSSITNVAKP